MNKILDNLYLGDHIAALTEEILEQHGITHILNVTDCVPNMHRNKYTYKRIKVKDESEADLYSKFQKANDFIEMARNKGKVLVHC